MTPTASTPTPPDPTPHHLSYATYPPIPPPGADHLRSLILQAVILHGGIEGRATGVFTSDKFAAAVAKRFDVRAPGLAWANRVLGGVAWVTRLPGRGGHWKVQTG